MGNAVAFTKAVKTQAKLRLGLDGPAGSGKTYTALVAAQAIANGGKVAVIDTERSSASLYADLFEFDVLCLSNFHPQNYIDGIHAAEAAGYAVIIIDSLSHAWEGEGGVLDLHEDAIKRQRTENSFTAWKDVTPIHRSLVDAMLQSSCHIIATMRSKTEYILEAVTDNGRTYQKPKKVGMAPIQRQGMEYEFTIVGDLDIDHTLSITKSRMATLADKVVTKPNKEWFKQILDWLHSGSAVVSNNGHQPDPGQAAKDAIHAAEKSAQELKDAVIVFTNGDLTLDEALAITNSKNVKYGDLTTKDLSVMYNAIDKKLKAGGYDAANQDTYIRKMKAAKMIMDSRNAEASQAG